MRTDVDFVLPQDILVGVKDFIQNVTGISVEYVSVTYKLLDHNPEATVYKTKIHERPLAEKYHQEKLIN